MTLIMRNYVIGAGVISFKYKNGIITCSDTQASYGNLCKYNNITRIYKLSPTTLINLSGEISDIQHIVKTIRTLRENDNVDISTKGYCRLVQRILYTKRSRIEPLNVSVHVLGIDRETSADCSSGIDSSTIVSSTLISNTEASSQGIINGFGNSNCMAKDTESGDALSVLGSINHLGSFHYTDVMATGLASNIVLPFLRSKIEGRVYEINKEEAINIAEEAMRIMCYRSCRNSNCIQIGIVEHEGVSICAPYLLATDWSVARKDNEIIIE